MVVTSPTTATVTITISPAASVGARTVTLTTESESASLVNGFTVNAGVPAITAVSPSIGRQAETLNVSIAAQFTSFAQGTTTANFGAGIAVNSVSVASATSATVNITIDPAAATGSRTVTLTTGGQVASLVGGFTVQPGIPAIVSVQPPSGSQGQALTVVMTGVFTNFVQGATTAKFLAPGSASELSR